MKKQFIFDAFVEEVKKMYKLSNEELLFGKNTSSVEARHYLIYLAHNRKIRKRDIRDSFKDLGVSINPPTIELAIKKFERLSAEDDDVYFITEKINNKINLNI
jgi:hypothetical protein